MHTTAALHALAANLAPPVRRTVTRRRSSSFSLIHEARPQAMTGAQYTQALFAAAITQLGCAADADAHHAGVDANDAGVLYALLLLFCTQHCAPRVHVYVPLGACLQRACTHKLGGFGR